MLFLGLGATAIIAIVAAYELMAPDRQTPAGMLVGSIDDFPDGSVSYVPDGHFYVANSSGFLRVFADTSPEFRFTETACRVRFYPNDGDAAATFVDHQSLTLSGMFRDDCTGASYFWWRGESNRPCECGLDQFPVRVSDG